jgi:uncharacterized protein YdcH (DUF465 family)
MYENRIKTLTETHRLLDNQIDQMEKTGNFTDEKLSELKKQRLLYKDEIARLIRLQWEHDHETIQYDDDR